MKATIESTDTIVDSVPSPGGPRNVPARVWEGVTEEGVEFVAYITCMQVRGDADNSEFERELTEHRKTGAQTKRAIDMRHVI